MGCGFVEAVYQERLEADLRLRAIPFKAQKPLSIEYKGTALNQTYVADLVCYEQIIVELKAVKTLNDEHRAQLHNYLRAANLDVGLLVNFGHYPKAQVERIVY